MTDQKRDTTLPVSRRTVVSLLAAGAGASAFMGRLPLVASGAAASQAANVSMKTGAGVVSIHMDLPYIDTTGTAQPYIPPSYAARYEQLASLSEEDTARWMFNC